MKIDAWIIIFTIAAAQGCFVSAILFTKKENRIPNRLLGTFLLLLAITLTDWLLWWTDLIRQVPGFMAITIAFPLLYGPILYLFYQASFQKISKHWWLHFIPAIIIIIWMLPFYIRFIYRIPFLLQLEMQILRSPLFIISVFLQMIGYGIWIWWQFRAKLKGELLRWHRWILLAYTGIIICYILYRILPMIELEAPVWKYLIALSLTVFIYLIAWLGYAQPQLLSGLALTEALKPQKYHKSSLSESESQQIFQEIVHLMETNMLYANSEFKLETLSQRLQKSRHHISQAINEQTGNNFADFINTYRIKAAQALLTTSSKREKNVIEIAYEVGFNSKKAFNLAFKKVSGVTPTEYRQSQQKKG